MVLNTIIGKLATDTDNWLHANGTGNVSYCTIISGRDSQPGIVPGFARLRFIPRAVALDDTRVVQNNRFQ